MPTVFAPRWSDCKPVVDGRTLRSFREVSRQCRSSPRCFRRLVSLPRPLLLTSSSLSLLPVCIWNERRLYLVLLLWMWDANSPRSAPFCPLNVSHMYSNTTIFFPLLPSVCVYFCLRLSLSPMSPFTWVFHSFLPYFQFPSSKQVNHIVVRCAVSKMCRVRALVYSQGFESKTIAHPVLGMRLPFYQLFICVCDLFPFDGLFYWKCVMIKGLRWSRIAER